MKTLIKNIKKLVQVECEMRLKVSGKEMAKVGILENAWLLIENDKIAAFGTMDELQLSDLVISNEIKEIDASGKLVFPSFVDSHTHLVYAGSREIEYIDKIKGLSYEEIAKRGGGILNSAKRLQEASEDELYKEASFRIKEIIGQGTGAVEIKRI